MRLSGRKRRVSDRSCGALARRRESSRRRPFAGPSCCDARCLARCHAIPRLIARAMDRRARPAADADRYFASRIAARTPASSMALDSARSGVARASWSVPARSPKKAAASDRPTALPCRMTTRLQAHQGSARCGLRRCVASRGGAAPPLTPGQRLGIPSPTRRGAPGSDRREPPSPGQLRGALARVPHAERQATKEGTPGEAPPSI